MKLYGLLGQSLTHSFSKNYFQEKFTKNGIQNVEYQNFEIPRINDFTEILRKNKSLAGLNVTFPYKELIMPFLDEISPEAQMIGAVNTIQIKDGKSIGYNTDFLGFEQSLLSFLQGNIKRALVLGTGGASKAVCFALKRLGITYQLVSRRKMEWTLSYDQMISELIFPNTLIINCTPVGTFPKTEQKPPIPYHFLKKTHFLYDLVYNPEETTFLQLGKQKGCKIKNGFEMLVLQAEASWEIWNS